MTLLWLLLGFTAFMAVIASVHLVNRYGAERFGYEPFSAPNAALMLIPNGLLLSLLSRQPQGGIGADPVGGADAAAMVMVTLWVLFLIGMLVLIARRTRLWLALYAAPLLAVAAPVILLALLYRWLVTPTGPQG